MKYRFECKYHTSTFSFGSDDSRNSFHCFQKLVEPSNESNGKKNTLTSNQLPPLLLDPLIPFPLAAFFLSPPTLSLSVSILESGSPSSAIGWFFSCCFMSLNDTNGKVESHLCVTDLYFILVSRVALCSLCWVLSVLTLSTWDSILLSMLSQLSHQAPSTFTMEPISLFLIKQTAFKIISYPSYFPFSFTLYLSR